MTRFASIRLLLCTIIATLSITSCLHRQDPRLTAAKDELTSVLLQKSQLTYTEGTYNHFVSHNQYPVTIKIYKNPELMAKANNHSLVVICLDQQRGRLYVEGQVAADWPVSTGIPGRETPAGNYKVLEKKEQYASNRYGKMYDAEGKCINSDADAFSQAVPEGGKFVGSPMPYWHRLTHDGIGMHIGKVAAGRRLSHGCIRTPSEMARELYRITKVGTKVTVTKELESFYPAREALSCGETQKALDKREKELRQQIYDLTLEQARKRGY